MGKNVFKRVLSLALVLVLVFPVTLFNVGASVGYAAPAQAADLSLEDFSGRLGEWDGVDHDSAISLRDTLMGIKAFQQDGFLYISVEAEAEGFGPAPTVYIDNGATPGTTKYQVAAWSLINNYGMWNNRVSHRIVDGKLQSWQSGAGDAAVWADVAGSTMLSVESAAKDFREYRIPFADIGVAADAKNIMRVGYYDGQAFYRPVSGQPMLVVDPPMQDLDKANMPQITVDGDPSEWLAQGLKPIASGDRRTSNTTSDMFGGDMYAFRDGDWLYILLFGKNSHVGRAFDSRGAADDAELCIVMNTDANSNTGYSPSFTTMYTAAGADYQIRANYLHKFNLAPDGTGSYDNWEDFGSLLFNQAAYVADPKAYVCASNEPFQRAYGVAPGGVYTDFAAAPYHTQTGNNDNYFAQCVEMAVNLSVVQDFGGDWMADIIKLGIFIDGSAYMPHSSSTSASNAQGLIHNAYAAVPCGLKYNFTMTGAAADWERVETRSEYPPNQYELNITTDGEILYTMVSGVALNTQNVYFIDVGAGGYNRLGRPGVDYIVANGYLYQPTADRATDNTPEYIPATGNNRGDRLSRIKMEYFDDNIMMQLRLDQIGNPDPNDIKISWYGKNAVNLPVDTATFLPLTTSFTRLREPGVYYPIENYNLIYNPHRGQAPSSLSVTNNVRMSYQEMTWRQFEATKGQYNFNALNNTSLMNVKNAGNFVNLRFQTDDLAGSPPNMDIPTWLFNEMEAWRDPVTGEPFPLTEGAPAPGPGDPIQAGVFYNSSGVGRGFAPNYSHPLFIEYHEKAIQALAAEIAKPDSPWSAVANMQIGSLGHWGEYHNWPEEDSGKFPYLSVSEQIVQHYIDAFADNPNVQLAMRYANPQQGLNNLGLFNDLIGQYSDTIGWVSWFTNGRPDHWKYADTYWNAGKTIEEYLADAANPDFWKYSLSCGEYGNNGTSQSQSDGGVMQMLDATRKSHSSVIGPRGPNPNTNPSNASNQAVAKNIDAVYDILGYIYVVEEFSVDDEYGAYPGFFPGAEVEVNMTVNNKGVAPFYRVWPLEISLIDESGNVAQSWITNVDIREWLPGRNDVKIPLNLPLDTDLGNYTWAVAIMNPETNAPSIDFNIYGKRADGKYAMGFAAEVVPAYVVDAIPTATVEKCSGNSNILNIVVDEVYSDGAVVVFTETYTIDNNSEGIYRVGPYTVYVNTKGNDQIREIYVVSQEEIVEPPDPGDVVLVGVETSSNASDIVISGSNVWTVEFNVTEIYSDGGEVVVPIAVQIGKNSSGEIDLGEYILIYNISGNGSTIKDFRVVLK
ncbi:MAG: DUF4832 domain-containing protein [Oscillospiraceae bacterium]|nr:DUF4832 domain-containing protein [Oscillospiraceae bacterium]